MLRQCVFYFSSILLFEVSLAASTPVDQKDWPEHTLQFQKTHQQDKYYVGKNNTKNYFAFFHNAQNSIEAPLIILTGLEDLPQFWLPTVEKAFSYGFKNVFIVELRGQGLSERVPGNKKKAIHINNFDHYSHDLLAFFKILDQEYKFSQRPYFISHSTGSTVITNTLAKIKILFPQLIPQKMSFWTPLIKLPISPFLNNFVVRNLLSVAHNIVFAMNRLILIKTYIPENFKDNHLTTSEENFKIHQHYKFNKQLSSSGLSLKWVLEAIKGTRKLRDTSFEEISMPTQILKAELDQVVDNHWILDNENITIKTIPGAKHALNIEKDEIFNSVIKKTFDFFLQDLPTQD